MWPALPTRRRGLTWVALVPLGLLPWGALAAEGEDRDGDGVPDAADRCPEAPGIPFDGCPCMVPLRPISDVRFTQEPVFLPRASELQPEDRRVLAEVAAVLVEHPEIHRVALVGGATSDEGPDLRALGLRRAEAVKAVLLAAGVAPERLEIGAWPEPREARAVELLVCPEQGCELPG